MGEEAAGFARAAVESFYGLDRRRGVHPALAGERIRIGVGGRTSRRRGWTVVTEEDRVAV